MNKIIPYLAGRLGIATQPLLEKDILLHRLLLRLLQTTFKDDFIFKGGTCLIKCYIGYYRFSEDLDFTYRHSAAFEGLSQKEIRRRLSEKIDDVGELLARAALELGLRLTPDRTDVAFIECGGSNKMVTYKLWYTSTVTSTQQFIKIQINFVEKLLYRAVEMKAQTLWRGVARQEIALLFPDHPYLLETVRVPCYDLREILVEKIRAILTRKGVKSRDFIDIYLVTKTGLSINDFEQQILAKVQFALRYDKYTQNLEEFNGEEFVLGEEEKILLRPLPDGFDRYLQTLLAYLRRLSVRINPP